MNPNWRIFPLVYNLVGGTAAMAISPIASYPRLTIAAGLLCYGAAGYVAINWIKRIRYLRSH